MELEHSLTPRNTIWEHVQQRLSPSEIDEAKILIGSDRVEKLEQLKFELEALSSMSVHIPTNSFAGLEYRKYEDKITFFIEQLRLRQDEFPVASVSQTEKEKVIIE